MKENQTSGAWSVANDFWINAQIHSVHFYSIIPNCAYGNITDSYESPTCMDYTCNCVDYFPCNTQAKEVPFNFRNGPIAIIHILY